MEWIIPVLIIIAAIIYFGLDIFVAYIIRNNRKKRINEEPKQGSMASSTIRSNSHNNNSILDNIPNSSNFGHNGCDECLEEPDYREEDSYQPDFDGNPDDSYSDYDGSSDSDCGCDDCGGGD